ncbi:MAG: outer membrane protein assembly factor BamA [Verrucomicrobia bacterium]|nr:MAG: outer membrane protein assembly factor BamA [Verrucomicrobiota bacterium]
MDKKLLILFVAFSGIVASAEIIKDIRIVDQAGESYDMASVAAFTSFKVGEQVSDQDHIVSSIGVDVNRMRESGRYSYVNARMDVEGDGVVLVYTVVAKHKLRRIEISGAKKMRNKKVRKKSELVIGQFADDVAFAQATTKIKEAYRDFWYPDARVEWTTRRDDQLGTVDVTFQIKEGRKLGIKKIVFEGNDLVDDKTLRKVMQQKQKWLLSFITGAGKYKPENTDMDVFAIKSLYMNAGFLDVTVSDPELDDENPKKTRMVLTIDEGQRYRVGKIAVAGMENFEEQELRRGIRLGTGDVAALEDAEAGSESIRAFYGNRGYIRTSVRPVFDANAETGTVDVRYEVGEGSVGYINKVNITGNERTKDKVIRRELVIYPGDKYNRSRVKTSENRLRNLNFFEIVTTNPEPTGEGDKYDLNVQVKEKSTGQFMAGVGFSSVESLMGYVELSQGNFNWKTWPPIGAGQKFKVRATVGTERNDLVFSFVEPWFLDRKLSFGADLYHRESRYFSDAYDQKNNGARFSLGKPLSRFTRGTLAYTMEQFEVFDVQASASPAIKAEEGKRLKSGLEFIWSRDTRDRFFNPTRGNKTTITPYFAGGPLGAETDIYGAKVRSAQYWPLLWDTVLNLRGQIESVDYYGDTDHVPLFDRLFLGGSYTLRGYEYRDVGPKDENGEPVGGNSSAYATLEYTVPIWSKVRGAVFYDWGVVNLDALDFDTFGYNDNWGIGIRLDLPGFPLHLDYAWPITYDEQWHDGKGRFNFLIGHTF